MFAQAPFKTSLLIFLRNYKFYYDFSNNEIFQEIYFFIQNIFFLCLTTVQYKQYYKIILKCVTSSFLVKIAIYVYNTHFIQQDFIEFFKNFAKFKKKQCIFINNLMFCQLLQHKLQDSFKIFSSERNTWCAIFFY